MRIKKDMLIRVISGNDKGKEGKVLFVLPKGNDQPFGVSSFSESLNLPLKKFELITSSKISVSFLGSFFACSLLRPIPILAIFLPQGKSQKYPGNTSSIKCNSI